MDKYTIHDKIVFVRACRNALEELFREVSRCEFMLQEDANVLYKQIKEFNLKMKQLFDAYIACYESTQKEFIVDGDIINLLARYSAYIPKDNLTAKINMAMRRAGDNDYEALMTASVKHRCGVVLSEEELDLIEGYLK